MVLAGRSRELEAVVAVLVGDTDAAALVLAGEAGVGKSRLLAAAAGIAAESGVLLLVWQFRQRMVLVGVKFHSL